MAIYEIDRTTIAIIFISSIASAFASYTIGDSFNFEPPLQYYLMFMAMVGTLALILIGVLIVNIGKRLRKKYIDEKNI